MIIYLLVVVKTSVKNIEATKLEFVAQVLCFLLARQVVNHPPEMTKAYGLQLTSPKGFVYPAFHVFFSGGNAENRQT